MENTHYINCESDFTVVFTFPGGERPAYPWQMVFMAGHINQHIASFDGEKYHNATLNGCPADQVRIEFKHHQLGCGPLRYAYTREVANDLFSDGKQGLLDPYTSCIVIHEGPSDDSPIPDQSSSNPYLTGKAPRRETAPRNNDVYT